MTKPTIFLSSAKSTIRAVAANEFGKAIILGTDNPEQMEHTPLTETQKCDVAAMILMCYADFIRQCDDAFEADSLIDKVIRERR